MSCADLMKALADQTRLAVVNLLLDGPRPVHQLNAVLKVEPTLLSHHLKELRTAGLIVAERKGRSWIYRLAPQLRRPRRRRVIDFGCCELRFPKLEKQAVGPSK
jgi:ArsR family transcriptional regulator, nickel/cobalt-responsive transcriptional repressor